MLWRISDRVINQDLKHFVSVLVKINDTKISTIVLGIKDPYESKQYGTFLLQILHQHYWPVLLSHN